MYSLRLHCTPEDAELLSAELWDLGTAGIRELGYGDTLVLIAAFSNNSLRAPLLAQFSKYRPEWQQEEAVDWVQLTHDAWPPRAIGQRLFLAPPWCTEETPENRLRIMHNPGLACGTGEHPCTQLAMQAIEECMRPGSRVVDIGTGSGILVLAALRLGADFAVGADLDESALQAASENFKLNGLRPILVAGSADAFADGCADLVVANINGTVLLSIFDDLVRLVRPQGQLILTGYTEHELPIFARTWPGAKLYELNEWRCLSAQVTH